MPQGILPLQKCPCYKDNIVKYVLIKRLKWFPVHSPVRWMGAHAEVPVLSENGIAFEYFPSTGSPIEALLDHSRQVGEQLVALADVG